MAIIPASDRTVQSGDNLLIDTEILGISHAALLKRVELFELKADQIHAIENDEESGPWQEVIADIDSLGREVEATRNVVKDPFERAVEICNGFFFALHAPRKGQTPGRLQKARAKIAEQVLGYLNRKEAAERQKREEAAKKAREEQAAAAAKAQEERRKQLAAEEEGRRKAASNAAAREAQATANATAAAARAFEAEAMAQAKPADLSRTRSDGGTLASTKVEWDFRIDDIDTVKGAPLWQYVPRTGKEAAIRAYIRANAPKSALMKHDGTLGNEDWQPLVGVTMICKRALQVR